MSDWLVRVIDDSRRRWHIGDERLLQGHDGMRVGNGPSPQTPPLHEALSQAVVSAPSLSRQRTARSHQVIAWGSWLRTGSVYDCASRGLADDNDARRVHFRSDRAQKGSNAC